MIAVVHEAATSSEIIVLEGLRTTARQSQLVKSGASRTMASLHLEGKAVDLGVMVQNELRWDWPLYMRLAETMQAAAKKIGVDVVWGGCWSSLLSHKPPELLQAEYVARCKRQKRKPFLDGPHYEVKNGPLLA